VTCRRSDSSANTGLGSSTRVEIPRFILLILFCSPCLFQARAATSIKVRITWGYTTPKTAPFYVRPELASGFTLANSRGIELENDDVAADGAWQSRAGAGDIDGIELTLAAGGTRSRRLEELHIIWADLIAAADADSAVRWGRDASFFPDSPKLTLLTNRQGTSGFSVTLEQLQRERAMWIPGSDMYITTGDSSLPFAQHREELKTWQGLRVLDRTRREPEATYEQYKTLWEDMGGPEYRNPQQRGPGHIVCLTWDSAIAKFGIDRGGGVWNDYGNPDHFRFWFDFGDLEHGAGRFWKSQQLSDGLPVITTAFERDSLRYDVEQFAYPLEGPPGERRGDVAMVLYQKVRITNLSGEARTVPVSLNHRREFAPYPHSDFETEQRGGATLIKESAYGRVMFAVEGAGTPAMVTGVKEYEKDEKRVNASVGIAVPARGSSEFVVRLPSQPVEPSKSDRLLATGYAAARDQTVRFWSNYVEEGAQFEAPEKAVNDLFRATLWHSLRLPRRHGAGGPDVQIDLPYSNFAYSQTGTPWPINQSVYVDYGIYDLRGYPRIAAEEIREQFRRNQEANGHITGYANWVTYTPGLLYGVAGSYLLSQDSEALERVMPQCLRAMDWMLDKVQATSGAAGWTRGLVHGPLNDGTGDGFWAFNQAYAYAGLERFGTVLKRIGHPRAGECLDAARGVRESILRAFAYASARSPLVQLRDHTWIPFVPSEAATFRRLLEVWYPSDVDTGPLHLVRLGAIPPDHPLADSLLNDHEDNLFYRGLGMANEPVYNQQATAYLLRDEPEAAIRAFYSYIASAFSHTVFEPVEHRFTHGQYFGPPSTDGAWFELYRNMLIRETDADELLIAQATPRRWLQAGKKIAVRRAPTRFGETTFAIEHKPGGGIVAEIETPSRSRPKALILRVRHPEARPIRSVSVNGREWKDVEIAREQIRIQAPNERKYLVQVNY
jgi:hypothetical protein